LIHVLKIDVVVVWRFAITTFVESQLEMKLSYHERGATSTGLGTGTSSESLDHQTPRFLRHHPASIIHAGYNTELTVCRLDKASGLIHKFWGLNSEFEPTLELDESYLEEIRENVKMSIAHKRQMVLCC
jgi:hypothetical protein